MPCVDCLLKTAEDYRAYNLSFENCGKRLCIPASGVAVFGPAGPVGTTGLPSASRMRLATGSTRKQQR